MLGALSALPAASLASEAKDVIGGLIDKGDLVAARQKAQEYLAKDPDDIDALMMKGNVILNEYFKGSGAISVSANMDESIYETSIGYIAEPVRVVPRETAEEVAALWKRCLKINPRREDIQMGLCYLYSMALMKEELLDRFPKMKAAIPQVQNLYYNMGDYARMFEQRGRVDDCFEIYKAIVKLYPDVSGVNGDVAALYFRHGKYAEGLPYLETALSLKDADDLVYANGVLIFTIVGEYDKARAAAKGLAKVKKDGAGLLYDGVLDYAQGSGQWKKKLSGLSGRKDIKPEFSSLAAFLISQENKDDIASYKKSVKLAKDSGIQILLHDRARKRFPGSYEPRYNYAEMLVYYKNYHAAIPLFKEILSGTFSMSADDQEAINFHYAWALQDSGSGQDADRIWSGLLTSKIFYVQSAAAYFLGKNALDVGKKKEAIEYFKMFSDKASKSKYATISWNRLNWLEKEK
jgi:tetratricopeptide (TPR) repeat protein